MKKIRVYVIDKQRKFLTLKWTDHNGVIHTESSECKARGPAERKAADKERELNAALITGDGSKPWEDFVSEYQHQQLSGMDAATERWHLAKLNVFGRTMTPETLADVTAPILSQYVAKLRTLKRAEDTIRGHLIAIKCAMEWASTMGMIAAVPAIPESNKRKGTRKKVKGRNLEFWEFCRMVLAVKKELQPHQVASWQNLLIGLWLSGLRIAEASELSWDILGTPRIDLSGKFPLLDIPAEHDKGREDRLMPLTPDFARFILRTPDEQRTGYVFNPLGEKGEPIRNESNISRTISLFGKSAKIIVDHKRTKYASAHDLRRTFGTRWSKRVHPIELKDLMRHAQISTTMTYYVGDEAQQVAARLWEQNSKVPLLVPPADRNSENTTK